MSSSLGSMSLSGGTGLDVGATVDQMIYAERAPERLWQKQQQMLTAQAGALRDLNGRLDALEGATNILKDLSGALGTRVVTISDATVLSATAATSAEFGEHVVVVNELATTASQYSDPPLGAGASFTPGQLQLRIGGGELQTISFDEGHNTVATAAEYINGLGLGLRASVVSDATGERLAIVSGTSGEAGDLTVEASPMGLGFKVGIAGVNARLTVDGVPVESSTNKVTGVLAGVTLDLTSKSNGSAVKVTVTQDIDRSRQAIQDWVSSYNGVLDVINANFKYNEMTKSAGLLAGNSSVRGVQSRMLSMASFQLQGNGEYTTLRSLGVEMQDDGKLKVNDSVLNGALKDHMGEVTSFFQSTSPDGFARELGTELSALTDSTEGPLVVDAKGMEDSSKVISDQIDAFEARLEMRRQTLTDMYTRIDTMLRQLPLLQAQLTAQLGGLK